ncbi:MAG: ParA family protein [bacterium]|nr:ParA family protein [bacterium]
MTRRILVHNPKGGVGKTVVVALAAEWFLHRGRTVNLIDADGNHSCQEWVDNNREEGREISTPVDADVEIVDTKGVPGSAVPFLRGSDLILTPFQLYGYDVSEVIEMFDALPAELRRRVGFIPNRVRAMGLTREQAEGFEQIESLIRQEGVGRLLPGLVDRVAVYPDLFNGSPVNFFERPAESGKSVANAQQESAELFRQAERILGLDAGAPR